MLDWKNKLPEELSLPRAATATAPVNRPIVLHAPPQAATGVRGQRRPKRGRYRADHPRRAA